MILKLKYSLMTFLCIAMFSQIHCAEDDRLDQVENRLNQIHEVVAQHAEGNANSRNEINELRASLNELTAEFNRFIANVSNLNVLVPIGAIIEYSGINPPSANWLECNGRAVSAAQYPELAAAIGITYGQGDALNTFRLPDRRGYVAVGIGSDDSTGGRVTNATAPNIALGRTFGEERHQLTIAELARHEHNIRSVHLLNTCGVPVGESRYGHYPMATVHRNFSAEKADLPHFNGDDASSGSNGPHNNMQPSIFMKFYIRAS